MEIYAVIMAGGVGSRFWPRSKEKKPKQLLQIFGKNTMIQDTVNRLEGIVKKENILIITNRTQKPMVKQQLPDIPVENIIDEPFGKNTAPCIGLASVIVQKRNPDAVMVVLPADHLIPDTEKFQSTILTAAKFASSKNSLCTIGIQPSRPETGYGYIQISENSASENVYKVLTFAEKPNKATAERFVDAGDFFWNAGMFIWKVDFIINEIRKYMPELYEGILEIKEVIGTEKFSETLIQVYGQLKSISIDYGIMEKSNSVYLIKGIFDWNDVGSWEAVYQLSPKDKLNNFISGNIYTEKTSDSYIFSDGKFTAVIGAQNLIVIDTPESLLICNRENAQDVKLVVDHLKLNNKTDLF